VGLREQAGTAEAATEPESPAGLSDELRDSVMNTVFGADGNVLSQNPVSRACFDAPAGDTGASDFLRHFVDPAEGAELLARLAAGETVRAELPAYTKTGVATLSFVASPLIGADGERTFLLCEAVSAPIARSEHEQRFRDYAEAAADWFWEMDAALCFSQMSESTQLPGAVSTNMFIGQRLTDIAATDESGDWRTLVDQLAARLPFRDIRFPCRDGNGVAHHLSLSGLPVFDGDGRFKGYRGIGRDLTLLLRAEKHAAVAQNRLMDAIESIPSCFLLLDAEDRLVLCNSRYREVNAPIAPWLEAGTALSDIDRASADLGAVRPASGALDQRFKPDAPEFGEGRLGDRWFQISERRTHDGGSVVVQTEITALKRREQELAEKTAMLRATLDNMRQGLFVLDSELKLRLWNDQFCEICDVPLDVPRVGLPIAAIIRLLAERGVYGPGETDALVAERLAEMCNSPSSVDEIHFSDGRVIERRASPMPDGGMVATYLDITSRKRVEADLRRAKEEAELASRSKTEFLANMSHELRTPLNAIIGFAEILGAEIFGPLGDKRYAGYAVDIRDSGEHLLKLINDVLDVSKIEFGKVELQEESTDAAGVIESCVRLMRDRAEEAELTLSAELPLDLPFVHADARRLKQNLLNLLSNAVKFTEAGGRIVVRAIDEGEGQGFAISVSDTGIGIATNDLDKAMRPFGQIDSRMTRKYQGTGLGLPLTKSMIELHGGRLDLDSVAGRGTVATIWLPPERVIRVTVADVIS
jgi:signal transduction histidine kinase